MTALVVFLSVTLPWLNPFSPGPTSAVGPLLFSWACAAAILLVLAVHRHQGQTPDMVLAVALGWVCAAALSALIGLLQYFGATAPFGDWLNHTELGVAYGNLRQRNQYATLINLGVIAVLWHSVQPAPSGRWGAARLGLACLLAALLGTANAASSSRTGLLQLILLVALVLWWQPTRQGIPPGATLLQRKPWVLVLLAATLAYVLASVALPLLAGLDPLTSGAWARLRAGDAACFSRLTLWQNVLHLIYQKPWLGWGWGELDYAHFITLYPGARFCDILDNAHNLPLHLAVELGVPVAVLACGALGWLIWRTRPWRESAPTRQLAWGILAVIGLHSLLEYPLWYGPFQIAAALCVWLLTWLPRDANTWPVLVKNRPLALYFKALSASVLILFCGFASWNYFLASQIYLDPEQRAASYRENTIAKTQDIWLYQDQVRFAELTINDVTAANAANMHRLALDMLHFSPEARVVEKVLETAQLLGLTDEVRFYALRLKVAFPTDYARWLHDNPGALAPR